MQYSLTASRQTRQIGVLWLNKLIAYPCQLQQMAVAILLVVLVAESVGSPDPLEKGFQNPPPECRPDVFMDWMGGMISKEGISKDLEALASQGVGGVMIMQLPDQLGGVVQWPFRDYPGKVKCLSEEWFSLMNHTISEGDRLGLTVSTLSSPGWSHVGGPWVTPAKGLKVLVSGRTEVKGPSRFEGVPERAPFSYEARPTLPEWATDAQAWQKLKESWKDTFYKDVAVIARPASGGTKDQPIQLKGVLDLTKQLDAQGRLTWDVPAGEWTILRLGVATFNSPNYPAPVEAAGLECDRLNPEAVRVVFDHYIGRIAREARAKGYKSFKGFDTDSYEGGFQDFCADFPSEFHKRHGYDCIPWLPAWIDRKLVIDSPDLTARFRRDMLQTVSDLWLERFYGEIRRFADENDLQWMIEPYFKLTIDWRTVASRAHAVGSEFWIRNPATNDIIRDLIGPAPDTAALYGNNVVWAEAYTSRPDNSAWRNDPWRLKPYGDAAYCRGVNHFVMHGFVHNPFGDDIRPGLSMGFWGTQFSRNLTWWPYASAWTLYQSRCQFLLRQGLPVSDVLVYPPRTEHIPSPVLDCAPYKQTVCNDETLMARIRVKNGRLVLPHGVSFAALVLSPNKFMFPTTLTPQALQRIRDLVGEGATLIGSPPPARSASMENYPDCDKTMARLITELWSEGKTAIGDRKVGLGRVLWGRPVVEALNGIAGGPDVEFKIPVGTHDALTPRVDFFHRCTPEADIYFVANLSDAPLEIPVAFRVTARAPELWYPVTGQIRPLPDYSEIKGKTLVPLSFAPRESYFVIFRKQAVGLKQKQGNFPVTKMLAEIQGAWDVSFDPKWGGPANVRFEELHDWTQSKNYGIKYYSGTAVYRKTFDLPQGASSIQPSEIFLDLGTVKNLARVHLNGMLLGTLWCAPWRIEIGKGIKARGNQLEIAVVNTWVNRIIGDEQEPPDADYVKWEHPQWKGGYTPEAPAMALKDLPDWLIEQKPRPSKGRFTFINWQYYPKDAPLPSSGLHGPVRIVVSY